MPFTKETGLYQVFLMGSVYFGVETENHDIFTLLIFSLIIWTTENLHEMFQFLLTLLSIYLYRKQVAVRNQDAYIPPSLYAFDM